jgi:hypothetical protein
MPTEKLLNEEMNTAGSGAVAGIGVGPDGEPGVNPKRKTAVLLAQILSRRAPKGLDNA